MHEEVEFQYCPVCGGKLVSRALKPEEPNRLVCAMCDFVFYLDPKVVACSIVEMDGGIVLLKRAIDPQKGKWVLPGGYVDRGEEVKAAAVRETEEECGLRIRIKELLGLYSYPGKIAVVVVYVAEPSGGDLIVGDETAEAGLYHPESIPWKELAFQSTIDALKDYLRKREHSR
ncbi:MAG: NUDIX hydrolase [Deltaproteobacteria bacterium]|nr:NUDIX hydrolase [Deltaproteobacteria bacterium]